MKFPIPSGIGWTLNLLFVLNFSSLAAQNFLPFLEELAKKTGINKNQEIESYLARQKQLPLIEGDSVIFLAHARLNTPPALVADFNGFLHPRYVKDQTLGQMEPIPGSQWYYLIKKLPAEAIINYSYAYGEDRQNDPLNPNQRIIFGSLTSFVAMPAYQVAPELVTDHSLATGTVQQLTLSSENLGHDRTLHIYLPAGYETHGAPMPTLYLHDGSFYVQEGGVPQLLDYLIAHRLIRPLIAIFDDPVVRGKEYQGDPSYIAYIGEELIPYVDGKFRTSQQARDRAIIGGSRGGLSALHLSHALPQFGNCGAFSPAIVPMNIPDFTQILNDYSHQPQRVYITASSFDYIWYQDAFALKSYFEEKASAFQYQEIYQGHNIPAWCSLLDDMLTYFFPYVASDDE